MAPLRYRQKIEPLSHSVRTSHLSARFLGNVINIAGQAPGFAWERHTPAIKPSRKSMSREQNYLVTYGLHNYVTYTLKQGEHSFFINSQESQKMISHAKDLLESSFGKSADIRVG